MSSNKSNCSVTDPLSFLFVDEDDTVATLTRADALVIQSTPTAAVLLIWLVIECCSIRPSARRIATLVGSITIAMQATMMWRTGMLLYCDTGVVSGMFLAIITCISTAVADMIVFAFAIWRSPRISIGIFILLAAATVGADCILRGGIIRSRASYLLVAVQQCFDITSLDVEAPAAPKSVSNTCARNMYTALVGVLTSMWTDVVAV